MKKHLFKLSAFALLMGLSLTAWAEGGPSGLGTVSTFDEGDYMIYYLDASNVKHYLFAGNEHWEISTDKKVIALSKGQKGWEETAYYLTSNGQQMSNRGTNYEAPGISTSNRDWESQVFYEKDGKYAIRCTNNNSESTSQWWPNLYVNVKEDGTELTLTTSLPSLGEALFIWNVEETSWSKLDAKEVLTSAQDTYDNTLWTIEKGDVELTTTGSQFSSNAPCTKEGILKDGGNYDGIIDNDKNTYYHSAWGDEATTYSNNGVTYHELYISGLSTSITSFFLDTYDRNTDNNHIYKMEVYGGTVSVAEGPVSGVDVGTFTVTSGSDPIATVILTGGHPGAHTAGFSIGDTGYEALCFRVVERMNNQGSILTGVNCFHAAEFHLWKGVSTAPKYDVADSYASALLAAINAINTDNAYDYSEAELAELLNAVTTAENNVKANAKVQYTINIVGNPSPAKVTIGGVEYANGATLKSAPIDASDVTATDITHYPYTVNVTGNQITVTYEGFTVTSLTDADQIDNTFIYMISTKRGYLVAGKNAVDVVSSDETVKADSLFALLKSESGKFYLYSVGQQKFVGSSGDTAPLTDGPSQVLTITDKQNADNYSFMFQYDSQHIFNHNGSKLVVNTYSTPDPGNLHKIVFAGEDDFTAALAAIKEFESVYTVTINGPQDAKVTFGGQAYANGAEIQYGKEIKRDEITITHYNDYAEEVIISVSAQTITVNYIKLPFLFTTDKNNPVLYGIRSGRNTTHYYTYTDDERILLQPLNGSDEQKWFFVAAEVGDERFIQLVPAAAPTKVMGYTDPTNGANKIFAVDPTDTEKHSYWTFVDDNGKYGLKPTENPNTYFSNYGGAANKYGFWSGSPSADQGSEMNFVSAESETFQWLLLQSAIATAETLGTVVDGDDFGKVTGGSLFNQMLTTAKAVEETAQAQDMKTAAENLMAAQKALKWNVGNQVFTMKCSYSESGGLTYTGESSYTYVDAENKVYWANGNGTGLNCGWILETEDGLAQNEYYLKNVATNGYVNAVDISGVVELNPSEKAKITVGYKDGRFTFTSEKGSYAGYSSFHSAQSGSKVVGWEPTALASQWTLTAVDVSAAAMSITAVNYGTFVAPFDVTLPDGVTASKITGVGAQNVLTEEAVATTIPANTPVVIYSADQVAETVKGLVAPGQKLNPVTEGLLTGVFEETEAPVGSYVLMDYKGEAWFGKVLNGEQPKVGANHAYLNYTSVDAPYLRLGGATNISNVNADADANVVYDLTGRRVDAPAKGIYIVNGKKVLVK